MSARVRRPAYTFTWVLAVVMTTLLVSRVVNFVGRQLSTDVALPRTTASRPIPTPPGSAESPAASPSSPGARPQTTPGQLPHVTPVPGAVAGSGRTPTPATPPAVVPGGSDQGGSSPVPPSPVTPSEPGSSPPPAPAPSVARPEPAPQVAPPPVVFSDLRVVQTAGGTASFRCSSADELAMVSSSPAPGYKQGDTRVRDSTRMDVTFEGATTEQKIAARCRDGQVDASVE